MMLTVDWGPVSSWFAAAGTIAATIVALLGGLGLFNLLRRPLLKLTFEHKEPWCRVTRLTTGQDAYWVRVQVENRGGQSARGCIGMVVAIRTDGRQRDDIDPVQLRWAGIPRDRGFDLSRVRLCETVVDSRYEVVTKGKSAWDDRCMRSPGRRFLATMPYCARSSPSSALAFSHSACSSWALFPWLIGAPAGPRRRR